MDNANPRVEEQALAPETPEDVAILYSWANLPGAKYRDFSASRREYRAQQRARTAEAQRQAELKAARELEEAAQREIEVAQRQLEGTRKAEADAAQANADAEAKRRAEEVMRRAEERAERERQEALRRQQSAEDLRVLAERAQEEMLEARKRAEEQAARYAEADAQTPVQVNQQARVLPGETTDPYYYTGPVDPAYFASTPGVRTARAARVSTERRAYVYPVHPGSDEFDSGTIVAYRSSNQFAPSPAQSVDRLPVQKDPVEERVQISKQERERPSRDQEAETQYDLDDDYYDGSHVARLFSPSQGARNAEGRESAPADLHIRPASRVSGEHEQPMRTVRPSPTTQFAPAPNSNPAPAFPEPEEALAVATSVGQSDLSEPIPVFRPAGGDTRRDTVLHEVVNEPAVEAGRQARAPYAETEAKDDGRLRPILYEEPEELAEEGSSRMFIPSPRRRLLDLGPLLASTHKQNAEPLAAEARTRDAVAAEGQRIAQLEVDRRAAQDRFVQEQETGTGKTEDAPAAASTEPRQANPEAGTRRYEPVHWRALNHAGESGFRRRRQPAREPIARTTRQPRTLQEPELATEASSAGEPAAPPAWLSGERRAARRTEGAKLDAVAEGSDLPATPGDPGVPAPRPVLRRQPSGLRPRAQAPSARAFSADVSTGPVSPSEKSAHDPRRAPELQPSEPQGTASDTLQQSRERVASRWFALSGLMGSEGRQSTEPRTGMRSAPHPAPMLCVLSISGGVGKTSIVATLGRALSSLGEKVLLADTNVHGILPYYFGAREQRPGAVRTFSPPPGSNDAPVVLVSYDADSRGYDEAGQTRVLDDLYRRANEVQRVLVDAGVNSAWLARTVAGSNPWVLVPVAPDMNSVLGTQAVERLFQDVNGADGRPVKPYYVLNQYDPTVPLHLDVREVLRQFLGERLLPIMLHRTPAVSEALAEGMTVIDYAPRSSVANDYMNLAAWVRKLADPGLSYTRPARWSER
ncbi:cellulose synthase operon protein YhjQ/BcsQ [Terriglobus sp.]|uniref:cellulose synthase operon protein YhjQ/BcsQ n=1 Tax=Terriglobus sp. TaxID=1889013 RepID=UPI003AFFBF39